MMMSTRATYAPFFRSWAAAFLLIAILTLVRSFTGPALAQTPQRQNRQSYSSKYRSDSSIQPPVACRKPLWRYATLREPNDFSNQNGDHSAAEESSYRSDAPDRDVPG
jgi:hypothetical protein